MESFYDIADLFFLVPRWRALALLKDVRDLGIHEFWYETRLGRRSPGSAEKRGNRNDPEALPCSLLNPLLDDDRGGGASET
jgi:hypothetical protein